MEIAIGMVGLGLGAVAVVSAYIWRANGHYIKMLQQAQIESTRVLQEGQKEIARSIEEVVQGTKVLQQGQKESTKVLQEGQKEIVRGLNQIALIAKGKD